MPTASDAKSAGSKKSENTNSFALLDLDDNKEEEVEQGKEDDGKTTDDEEKSIDLLYPPTPKLGKGTKKSILQLLHNNLSRTPTKEDQKDKPKATVETGQEKSKKTEPIPEILKIPDKKLRKHA